MAEPMTMRVELQPRHVKQVARVTYESVRALRASFGDISTLPLWNLADSGQQHNAEVIVRRVATCKVQDGPAIHAQWRDEMVKDGVRYDPADPVRREICEFSELSPEAQCRYHFMYAVAASLLAQIALIVVAERLRQQKT